MNNISQSLNLSEVSLDSFLWNLLICTLLSGLTCWHFNVRAAKHYLRRDLGLVLPIICLTTLLVITVVKSSLALSLGLVGALSIVRFRTPIKEPEELAYIFIAIATGLSLGADQREIAIFAVPIILVLISIIDKIRNKNLAPDGNLLIEIEINKENETIDSIFDMIKFIYPEANIRRIDQDQNNISIIALLKIIDPKKISDFGKKFDEKFPDGKFSLIDDSSIPNE